MNNRDKPRTWQKVLPLVWIIVIGASFSSCATSSLFAADNVSLNVPHVVLDSGHTKTINSITTDSNGRYLFTASDDGSVKVWNAQTGDLMTTLRVSHLPVVELAVNSSRNELAAVVSDGGVYFNLSTWNWETGKKLFSRTLTEIPLFLQYSPQGSFLLYGRTQWDSLVFLDSSDGHQLDYLTNGFGIVQFALISSSERTIMTYAPSSGDFTYWDLDTGTRKATVPSVANLTNLVTVSDAYVAGSIGNALTVVNIVTGAVVAQIPLGSSIQSITCDPNTRQIAVLYTSTGPGTAGQTTSTTTAGAQTSPGASNTPTGPAAGGNAFALYSLQNGNLNQSYLAAATAPEDVSALSMVNGNILYGNHKGEIWNQSPYSTDPQIFSKNVIVPVTDIAFSDDRFFAATNDGLVSIQSDFFNSSRPQLDQISRLVQTSAPNPLAARSGLLSLSNNRLFLWDNASTGGQLMQLDPATLGVTNTTATFAAAIENLDPAANQILSLEQNGVTRVISPYSFNTIFTFSSVGTICAAYTKNWIVLGKNDANIFGSSLIRVSPTTGETVKINSQDFLTFDLAFDPVHNVLYSLGLQHRNGNEVTVLTQYTGTDFTQATTIATYSGEDLQATLTYDQHSQKVFTTIGFDRVQVWDGQKLTQLANSGRIPRKVVTWNGRVYGVNRDGSVSVWDSDSGRHLFNFYVLADGSWVILSPNGYFLPSSVGNPTQYLRIVRPLSSNGGSTDSSNMTLQDFKLKIKGVDASTAVFGANSGQ